MSSIERRQQRLVLVSQTFNFLLARGEQRAPYVPRILHPEDTSNFDAEVGDDNDENANGGVAADDEDVSNSNVPEVNREYYGFYEFTFRRFWDDTGHPLPRPLQSGLMGRETELFGRKNENMKIKSGKYLEINDHNNRAD